MRGAQTPPTLSTPEQFFAQAWLPLLEVLPAPSPYQKRPHRTERKSLVPCSVRSQANVSRYTGLLTACSLYVRGLPDKLPKEDLKRNLYMLFATYGVILDVVAMKTSKMRGQAHVVFRDLDASTQAMRALQGFTFFGKDMVRISSQLLRD